MSDKIIKSAVDVYYFCYEKGNVTSIPSNWYITNNFSWKEAFTNEISTDGVPFYSMFVNISDSAKEFQKVRDYLGKGMNIHCWYRSIEHNVRAYIESGYSKSVARTKTRLGNHLFGKAIDFHITGMTDSEVRNKILQGVKSGKFKVRIEANTNGWVHIDCGNPYISGGYNWGLFYV